MKPARFDHHAPHSLEEALALLARYGSEAHLLASDRIPRLDDVARARER